MTSPGQFDWRADTTKLDCGGYVIRWREALPVNEDGRPYVVEFEAYPIFAPYFTDAQGVHQNKVLLTERGPPGCRPVEDFDPDEDNCAKHFCGPEGIDEVHRLFRKMYEIAGQVMGSHEWEDK